MNDKKPASVARENGAQHASELTKREYLAALIMARNPEERGDMERAARFSVRAADELLLALEEVR